MSNWTGSSVIWISKWVHSPYPYESIIDRSMRYNRTHYTFLKLAVYIKKVS